MIEGRCPKCGTKYAGWALASERNQTCPKCGVALEVTVNGHRFKGYSPFTAERYHVDVPDNVPSSGDKKNDTSAS